MGYELTAETATSCELSFVDRKHFLELMQSDSDVALHTAQSLSRDFQSAYRDMHDLVLTRSSAGKLARLLLSHSPTQGVEAFETRLHSSMTHEEMAQRIGSSRETVTRLLSDLKKKQLIRLDGPTLVIRDRTALEALAVLPSPAWPEDGGLLSRPPALFRTLQHCSATLLSADEECIRAR